MGLHGTRLEQALPLSHAKPVCMGDGVGVRRTDRCVVACESLCVNGCWQELMVLMDCSAACVVYEFERKMHMLCTAAVTQQQSVRPHLCCSSTMTRPSRANSTSYVSLCVPTTRSTVPSRMLSRTSRACFALRLRVNSATRGCLGHDEEQVCGNNITSLHLYKSDTKSDTKSYAKSYIHVVHIQQTTTACEYGCLQSYDLL